MNDIVVVTDDICPLNLEKWKYWERLKEKHSLLHVNVGIIPYWHGMEDQIISKNKRFKNWFLSNSDWITPILHGYRHDHPYGRSCGEFEGTYQEQQNLLLKALEIYKEFKGDVWGFTPSFWRYNEHTMRVLREANCSYMISDGKIFPLRPTESIKFVFLSTHTNVVEPNPDDIEVMYPHLDLLFSRQWKFLNINELMRGT